jgi:hypothetical protein
MILSGVTLALTLCIGFAPADKAPELTADQQLIVACYSLEAEKVAHLLRSGANVNARFGRPGFDEHAHPFRDKWDRGLADLGHEEWTPLLALAHSPRLPDPPEGKDVREKPELAAELIRAVTKEQLAMREAKVMAILLMLLAKGCALDADDGYGATALYEAVDQEKGEMAKMLLRFGANPNTKTQVYIDGPGDTTPLHLCRSRSLMQALLDHGADANAKDSEGKTPSEWLSLDDRRDFDLVVTPDGPVLRDRIPTD